ncbi:Kinesin-like protein KIN-14J [Sesamum alatum]|uniref:Kinesin-like protein KIN-14J n=1 Tax=Sesamum alatum TaxID=300844 RepID=A0AAE2CV77_9LAMI|nr:Kinesin-like protein KIN-14J [Sesamum alatum]
MHPIVSFNLHTLGIWNTSQPNGLAVPDASLHTVKSTADVLELMKVGLTNRAVGATALNERSSRSHSILTIHVRGTELETNAILRGCLHLVDLAGSERVDRSEATGDRLREAQHINKSLSALGDVIFALAQKSSHVPYRNSKLTQVLQSSLGGQAKTLMFVQLNPDVESYSETISTLKFAERVSGVELGAARSNKEGRGVRELMEQVASLKDVVAKKDEEIAQLRSHKPNGNDERQGVISPRYGSSSSRRLSLGGVRPSQRLSGRKSTSEKAASDLENSSEYSDKRSEAGSQQSMDEFKHHKEFFLQSKLAVVGGAENVSEDTGLKFDLADGAKNLNDDVELFGFGDDDSEERLSDISDGVLSMGTETDGSINSIVEYTLFPETPKPTVEITEKPNVPVQLPRPPTTQGQSGSSRLSLSKSSSKIPSYKKATASSPSALKPPKRWQ